MFSDIVQRFETGLNALYQERDARLARGQKVLDLVSGNVNRAGLVFPPAVLKKALARGVEQSKIYSPDPLGQKTARESVSRYYSEEGVQIPPDQIILTPGTSLSYHYLFTLLANPGDEILCPAPSYPLLDSIADLSRLRLTRYRLRERERWQIDLHSLEAAVTPRTRAIVLISPHNPTGAVALEEEIRGLAEISAARDIPIISDEVFSPFLFQKDKLPRPAAHPALRVYTLNGVSKMFALPGLKLGWIGVTGPEDSVRKAVHALDMMSDTFLPVSDPAQFALPEVFSKGKKFLKSFQTDVHKRMEECTRVLSGTAGVSYVRPEGGFYLTLRLPDGMDEEKAALDLLRKEGWLVHPGHFYDLEGSHLVFSFLDFRNAGSRFEEFFRNHGRY